MIKKIKSTVIFSCMLGLSSCIMNKGTYENLYYPASTYDAGLLYANNNYLLPDPANSSDNTYSLNKVQVPDTYHLSESHTPVSFRDRESTWVRNQNGQAFTIELAEGEKASQIAQILYKTPKNNRTAQIAFKKWGKTYYRAVYGSYNTAEEAQNVLDSLPGELKSNASVKNWNSVQP